MRNILLLIIALSALSVQAQSTNIIGCVTLAWNDPNPPGATDAYCLYHATNSTPPASFTKIATIQGGVTNVPVFIPVGSHYFYMTCSNWCGETLPSNVCSTNTPILLAPANTLRITSLVRTNGP